MPRSPLCALFFLWADHSDGTEHNFFVKRDIIPYASRCRGHIDIFKWLHSFRKYLKTRREELISLGLHLAFKH